MAGAAQLGALAVEDLARLVLLQPELEVVVLARDDVALEQEVRHVPGVDDVAADELHVDVLANRHGHAAAVWPAHRARLGREVVAGGVEVLELPLELAGEGLDVEVALAPAR